MTRLSLHDWHLSLGARFCDVNGEEAVHEYAGVAVEHAALTQSAGLLDLSFRSRLCILGADRERFLNGQVTNNVAALRPGQGCYAAVVSAKGKIESDARIYKLAEELLLDLEPAMAPAVSARLEKYVIADDVQIVDVTPHYGLLSLQGPKAGALLDTLALPKPAASYESARVPDSPWGDLYIMNNPRLGSAGYDLFVSMPRLLEAAAALHGSVQPANGAWCGWQAFEVCRVERGIPRFGQDMDASNLAPETGIESRAISYSKGCYIGQEVIARIRTYGQVAKALRMLWLSADLPVLPGKGTPLRAEARDVGYITSAVFSIEHRRNVALGYVRKEFLAPGTTLMFSVGETEFTAEVQPLAEPAA